MIPISESSAKRRFKAQIQKRNRMQIFCGILVLAMIAASAAWAQVQGIAEYNL